jgi:hypothetical protein
MSNSNHFAQEAQMLKSLVQQVHPLYEASAQMFSSLDPKTASWKDLSNSIRNAHAFSTQLVDLIYGYAMNLAEVESSKRMFGGSRAAMQVASALQPEIDKFKSLSAQWKMRADEFGVTLIRNSAPDEIGQMADAELLDAYRYRSTKLTEEAFQELVSDVKVRYGIGTNEFQIWLKETGNE